MRPLYQAFTVAGTLARGSLVLCMGVALAGHAGAQQSATPDAKLPATSAQEPRSSIAEVQQMLSRGQLKEAEAQLTVLAQKSPEPAGTERLLGMVHYQRNEFPAAEAAFQKAIDQNHDDLEAVQMLGVSLFRMGKAAEAIPLLERSNSAIANSNADGTYVLAASYMDVHRFDDARRLFAKQYKLPTDSAAAYLFMARMLFRREYLIESRQMAEKALAIDPRLPLAHMLLGQVDLSKSREAEAVTEFEAERKINPMDGEVYERLGDAYLRASRFEEAQQSLDCALLLEPNATGPYILLGEVLLKREDPATALNYLLHAEKMDSGNHLTHLLLGQAFRATGRKEDAVREYKMAENIQNAGTDKN
jgi:tetratricopeptide (TPR) repeat protein